MQIAGRKIENHTEPYIVAEISGNHAGSLANAIGLIQAAAAAGADAVKTQCYDADSMTIDCDRPEFTIQDGLWAGRKLYELYQSAATPPSWHPDLYQAAEDHGITIFSSVFDIKDIDLLEKLHCPAYKIASFEANNPYLIDAVHKTGKPVIVSTGVITDRMAVRIAERKNVALLHCVSEYPTDMSNAALDHVYRLRVDAPSPIGVSDHTDNLMIPIMATAIGAAIIEKHLKLDHIEGEDAAFSLNPEDFETMVGSVHMAYNAMRYDPRTKIDNQFARSIYVVKDIKAGELFTEDNIRIIRPSYGASPSFYAEVLGEEAGRDYVIGDPL